MKLNIITIDGLAGSGKSTVAHHLAKKLHWMHINTGAIYRTFAFVMERLVPASPRDDSEPRDDNESLSSHGGAGTSLDPAMIELAVIQINNSYYQDDNLHEIFLNGENITNEINTPHISNLASLYAQNSLVREQLLPIQRKIVAQYDGVIVDGRDMGTVVFPTAPLKIFLTANAETRARRRLSELQARGINLDYETLFKEMQERDLRDSTRNIAPSKPAPDAIVIDSSEHTVDALVNKIFLLFTHLQEY